MVLAFGCTIDTVDPVADHLRSHGVRLVHFMADKCLEDHVIGFEQGSGQHTLYIRQGDTRISLDEVKAVWYLKPHLPKELRTADPADYRTFMRDQFRALWHSLIYLLADRRWVSPHQNVVAAESKLLQLTVARELGWAVPDTLVTSEPDRARSFWHQNEGDVVIKQLATSPLEDTVIYTSSFPESKLMELERLRYSPVIFQRRIDKDYELRITVVGSEVFCARVDSQKHEINSVDWRRRNPDLKFERHAPDRVLEERCRVLVARLGLRYGCIDVVVTPSGEHVFLEINPNGQWYFIEHATGLPISSAIANLLSEAI